MTDEEHASPQLDHDDATHMDAHATLSDDDHGHAEQTLGPIDWRAWGFALLGAIAAFVLLGFLWLATLA